MNYLRNMRVGGNKAAREFFSKNGGSRYLATSANANEKYTSAVAKKYLQELVRQSSADARKYPGEAALEVEAPSLGGAKADSESGSPEGGSSTNNSTDDFFANWDRPLVKKPTPPVSRSGTPVNRTSSPLATAKNGTSGTPAAAVKPATSSRIMPNKNKANILGSRKTTGSGSSILGSKKPSKFVAKKVTSDEIDFEAAEKAAKEEAEHISKLGYNPNEEPKSPVATKNSVNVTKLPSSISSGNTTAPQTGPVEDVRKNFVRLGFGQTSVAAGAGANAPPAKETRRTITPAPVSDGSVTAKFGNQKGISSDQMFGRNAYDPAAAAEARTRLGAFDGATAISSASYFGRDEDENENGGNRGMSSDGDYAGVERAAAEFADRVRGMANEDLSALKDVLDQGASKLSGLMRDYLR